MKLLFSKFKCVLLGNSALPPSTPPFLISTPPVQVLVRLLGSLTETPLVGPEIFLMSQVKSSEQYVMSCIQTLLSFLSFLKKLLSDLIITFLPPQRKVSLKTLLILRKNFVNPNGMHYSFRQLIWEEKYSRGGGLIHSFH